MEQSENVNTKAAGAGLLEAGTWIGRHQAFGLMASQYSAVDAECLRQIRDNKYYKVLGLTWEEFCGRHTGVDRKTADRIVERLEEFGEAYFNLVKGVTCGHLPDVGWDRRFRLSTAAFRRRWRRQRLSTRHAQARRRHPIAHAR